jgi:hypothetical protein
MYAGIVEHSLLSSVQVSEREHVARYRVVMCGGEVAVLTFQLVLQRGVRAAYRSIAAESSWVLQRVCGEWERVQVRTTTHQCTTFGLTMQWRMEHPACGPLLFNDG